MISVRNLVKSYKNPADGTNNRVLDIPEWDISADTHLVVRGQSGLGKTTLLHCLSGIITPDSGSVNINGTDVVKLSESARDRFRANNIGYIFQSFNLLDGFTALENVMLGMMFSDGGSDRKKAEKLLQDVGLGDRMHNKPKELSMGQQQRVCIARAIANNPPLLLADEPTGSLDQKNSETVLELIREVAKGRVLILVTHEQEIIQKFDNVQDLAKLNKAVEKV